MTPPCAETADDVGAVVVASTEACVVLAEALEVSDALAGSSLQLQSLSKVRIDVCFVNELAPEPMPVLQSAGPGVFSAAVTVIARGW